MPAALEPVQAELADWDREEEEEEEEGAYPTRAPVLDELTSSRSICNARGNAACIRGRILAMLLIFLLALPWIRYYMVPVRSPGPSTPTTGSSTPLARDACLAAALTRAAGNVHHRYFLRQQDATRRFLRAVRVQLCSNITVDALSFQSALHALLQPLRLAIDQHVHSSFFVKSACSGCHEEILGTPSDTFCSATILNHEPYNTHEGVLIVRIVNRLMQLGTEGCDHINELAVELEEAMASHRSNALFSTFPARWSEACALQRTSSAAAAESTVPYEARAEALMEKHLEACCQVEPNDGSCTMTPEEMISSVGNDTELIVGAALHALERFELIDRCVPVGLEIEDTRALLRSVQIDGTRGADYLSFFFGSCIIRSGAESKLLCGCSGADGIPIDWLLTNLMLGVVYHKHSPLCGVPAMGRAVFGSEWMRCGARDLEYLDPALNDRCTGGGFKRSMCERDTARPERVEFLKAFAAWPWDYSASRTITRTGTSSSTASVDDGLPVLDLNFANDIRRCSGKACRDAAIAIDEYHRLLEHTSKLRTTLLRLLLPKPLVKPPALATLSNVSRQGVDAWFWNRLHMTERAPPRSVGDWRDCAGPGLWNYMFVSMEAPPCESVAELAQHMVHAEAQAAKALPMLRASALALDVTCVAAERPRTWWPEFSMRADSCVVR